MNPVTRLKTVLETSIFFYNNNEKVKGIKTEKKVTNTVPLNNKKS